MSTSQGYRAYTLAAAAARPTMAALGAMGPSRRWDRSRPCFASAGRPRCVPPVRSARTPSFAGSRAAVLVAPPHPLLAIPRTAGGWTRMRMTPQGGTRSPGEIFMNVVRRRARALELILGGVLLGSIVGTAGVCAAAKRPAGIVVSQNTGELLPPNRQNSEGDVPHQRQPVRAGRRLDGRAPPSGGCDFRLAGSESRV